VQQASNADLEAVRLSYAGHTLAQDYFQLRRAGCSETAF